MRQPGTTVFLSSENYRDLMVNFINLISIIIFLKYRWREILQNLFVYGTLMLPSVVFAVTSNKYRSEPAFVRGFRREKLKDKKYPAIVKKNKSLVDGLILYEVDNLSVKKIDFFEDSIYERQEVKVYTNSQEKHLAFSYVLPSSEEYLLTGKKWDVDLFKGKELEEYINNIDVYMKKFNAK